MAASSTCRWLWIWWMRSWASPIPSSPTDTLSISGPISLSSWVPLSLSLGIKVFNWLVDPTAGISQREMRGHSGLQDGRSSPYVQGIHCHARRSQLLQRPRHWYSNSLLLYIDSLLVENHACSRNSVLVELLICLPSTAATELVSRSIKVMMESGCEEVCEFASLSTTKKKA